MSDPTAGVAEMKRVTRRDGVVAACVWDHSGGRGPLSPLWDAVSGVDPGARDESHLVGTHGRGLARCSRPQACATSTRRCCRWRRHPMFDEWWEPFTLGVGPAGQYVAALDEERRTQLRERCRATLPDAPFTIDARAWTARGLA